MAVQEPRKAQRSFVRVGGADLGPAALAAAVLLVLGTLVAWMPLNAGTIWQIRKLLSYRGTA